MTAKELFTYLTHDAGFDEATAQVIMKAADNEKVQTRAQALKQQSEYDTIERRQRELEVALNGDAASGRQGAAAYQKWYADNLPAIQKLQADVTRYVERYGALDGTAPVAAPPAGTGKQFSAEDVAKIVHETIQSSYAPRWSDLLTSSGTIIERHMRAGRKDNIDWKKIDELAKKHNGSVEAAYEEWDTPARQAAEKTATDNEVNRRVKEELAKRQTQDFFPAGADAGSGNARSPLSHSRESAGSSGAKPTYDRNKVIEAAVTGVYEPSSVQ